MGMKEVISGVISDTVNERLEVAKQKIFASVDGKITNVANITAITNGDELKRALAVERMRTSKLIKEIVEMEINNVKVTPAYPLREDPVKNGEVVS